MKVSIITGTYNSEKSVRDTLACIAGQTHSDIEHIIVDGVSKDQTLDIVAQFPHVAKVVSEPDKGIYDAMNKGIQLTSGEIVGILNSDDVYQDSQVIEKVVKAFETEDIQAVYGDLVYVDDKNLAKVVRNWKSGSFNKDNFLNGWMPPHPTFFVRREVYEQYGKFDLEFSSAADYELMLRLLYKHEIPCSYIPETLVRMRVGGHSNATIGNRLRANKEDKLAWKKNGLKPRFYTNWLKPIRKIKQYIDL